MHSHAGLLRHSTVNVVPLPYDFLKNVCFPLAYFIVRIKNLIHMIYKIGVNCLFVLPVKLLINVLCGFSPVWGLLVPQVPALFKGQLYINSLMLDHEGKQTRTVAEKIRMGKRAVVLR